MLEVEVTDKIIQLEFYNGYVDGIILELKKKGSTNFTPWPLSHTISSGKKEWTKGK